MGKIITVGNLKGGTGKSTTAVNLACALARPERPVLLIDADAQATASDWLGEGPPSVDVLPLPLTVARDAEPWVARVMELRATYDVLVIDLPPQVGSGIASALLLADLFLVPVTPSGADLRATGKALDLLQRARATRGGERPACVLIPSKVDRRSAIGRRMVASLDRFGLKIGPTIRQRSAHIEAFGAGRWVGAHAPNGAAHAEVRALASLVERLLGLDRAQRPDKPEPHPVGAPAAEVVAAAGEWAAPAPAAHERAAGAAPMPASGAGEDDTGGVDSMHAGAAAGADDTGARGAFAGAAAGKDVHSGEDDGALWGVDFDALDADDAVEAEDAGAGFLDGHENVDPPASGGAVSSGARTDPDGEDGALWGVDFDAMDGDAGAEDAGADVVDADGDLLASGDDVADAGDGGARRGGAEPGAPTAGNGVGDDAGFGGGAPDRFAGIGEQGSQGRGMWGPAAGDEPDGAEPAVGHPLRSSAEPGGTAPVEGGAEDLEADGLGIGEECDPDAGSERFEPAEAVAESTGHHHVSEPPRSASTAASMSPLARLRHAFWPGRG